MLIPSSYVETHQSHASLSRRVNANSQQKLTICFKSNKLIKKGEC